jgi:hypothetical protein
MSTGVKIRTLPLHRVLVCRSCQTWEQCRTRHATTTDRARLLVERYGRDVYFFTHGNHAYHTLVTLAVECESETDLATRLHEAGAPWLMRHPLYLAKVCPLDSPFQPGQDWRVVLDRWRALGFDVNWPLVCADTLLTLALRSVQTLDEITTLVREYGCDAMAPSYLDPIARRARPITAVRESVTSFRSAYSLALLRARPWPAELFAGLVEHVFMLCRGGYVSWEVEAAWMRYVYTLQVQTLLLCCRRRRQRNLWLPSELWRYLLFDTLLNEW